MNIACVVPLQDKSGEITANLSQSRGASLRLQIYPAMVAAKKLGHTFRAFSIRRKEDITEFLENQKIDLLMQARKLLLWIEKKKNQNPKKITTL